MKQVVVLFRLFVLWIAIGMFSKVVFLWMYALQIGECRWMERVQVLWYGLRLDAAIAGYLLLLPILMTLVMVWYRGRVIRWIWSGYFILIAIVSTLGYLTNLGLYKYWGFPLDNTPVLYLQTSPKDALASMSIGQFAGMALLWLLFSLLIGYFCQLAYKPLFAEGNRRVMWKEKVCTSVALLFMAALMFIPIRGGFGTGTNHTGSVYFSSNIRLNHAAVNPLFCFVESVTHQQDLGSRYTFMEQEEAARIFDTLSYTVLREDSMQAESRPNVILICLEGFSKYIMTESGHVEGVTPYLDSLSREGWYFTNFYANSFRTDRALVSVLSGLPAQPTMSIMDIPRKSTILPSIARSLSREGYSTTFYYGGDTDYSNMKSYLMGTGFHKIVEETDFPSQARTGKWGVPDGPVYDRLLEDLRKEGTSPFFRMMMTESSHEPFDVPYQSRFTSPELNAFAYADQCLGQFIQALKREPCWENTLVILVPDHLGCYPIEIDNYALWRYELPLIFTGGFLKQSCRIPTTGSQIDIAATLLGMLGIPHEDFEYSKDLLDSHAPHFAFFTFPDAVGMKTDSCAVLYDITSEREMWQESENGEVLLQAKAYLQRVMQDVAGR